MPAIDLDQHATLLDTIAQAQSEVDALRAQQSDIDEKIRPWQDVIDACTGQIQALMGEAEEALIGGAPIATYKTYSRTSVDVPKLRAALPEQELEPFLRTTTTRRFRLLERGGE